MTLPATLPITPIFPSRRSMRWLPMPISRICLSTKTLRRNTTLLRKAMAGKWVGMAQEGDHYKLAFNSPGTWSQKYNLVWDQVLGFNLFPKTVRETEVAFYVGKINRYGLPLDIRADYTKLDWSVWTATLASDLGTVQRAHRSNLSVDQRDTQPRAFDRLV